MSHPAQPSRHSGATTTAAAATDDSPSSTASPQKADAQFEWFQEAAADATVLPVYSRILSDQLTPVLAYRCLVAEDDRTAPSFMFESVTNGTNAGRYSFVGAHPRREIVATGREVTTLSHSAADGTASDTVTMDDPMAALSEASRAFRPALAPGLPDVFSGGWVGYAGYDTVRYLYGNKLPFEGAPQDDRHLPDLHFALYDRVIVFDQASKVAYVVAWVHLSEHEDSAAAYEDGRRQVGELLSQLDVGNAPTLASGVVGLDTTSRPGVAPSNMTPEGYMAAVDRTKEYIQSGDVFQLVLSHRFERHTTADPFEVYRALRVINPSPYMTYLQARGSIIVASSPEILCRLDGRRVVTNRPLAGTRRRGTTPEEDQALEAELLADEKETAEHYMLVDLGRNDVGKVAQHGTVTVDRLMEVERYSHVMHISSTVTGTLLPQLDCWDALRAALPAGTVSGAPKVRAMQIIDELEAARRGPYGGGFGHVSYTGNMDMALALRTMIIPTDGGEEAAAGERREWTVHIQAGAGLVADSVREAEYEETVNKSAALGRSIDLAEQCFL